MSMLPRSALAAMALVPLVAAPAMAQSEPPVFQGAVFITSVNSICAEEGYTVGMFYTGIFRSAPRPNGTGGGLALVNARQTAVYTLADGRALLPGKRKGTFEAVGTSTRVGSYTFRAPFDLTISPIDAQTTSVDVSGKIGNYEATEGCVVGVRGAFTLRP